MVDEFEVDTVICFGPLDSIFWEHEQTLLQSDYREVGCARYSLRLSDVSSINRKGFLTMRLVQP